MLFSSRWSKIDLHWSCCLLSFYLFFCLRSVPTAPPQEVRGRARDSTSIELIWKAPPVRQRNGKITEYKVFYVDAANPRGVLEASVLSKQDTACLLQGLNKFISYRIWVTAATGIGDGPMSDVIFVQTKEDGTFGDVLDTGPLLCFNWMLSLVHVRLFHHYRLFSAVTCCDSFGVI